MPRRVGYRRPTSCTVCRSAERGRIDYLAASGAPLKPLAQRFALKPSAMYNHCRRHISEAYKRAVKIGPYESEDQLRKLCAESGTSVLENLRAIYGGLASRWLINFEAGADQALALLTTRLHNNLELQGRLTKELLPSGSTINTTFVITDDVIKAVAAMRPTPEQRAAFAAYYRKHAPLIEAVPGAATD